MLFQKLLVWRDSQARPGPENMAIDEWLMTQLGEVPILRQYQWSGDWVSMGYFQSLRAAKMIFGSASKYVRRWTGGGVVDHRNDATYSLMIPRSGQLASIGGSESYRQIHAALARCLLDRGHSCELVFRDSASNSVACFDKPVEWDLLCQGEKIAGAGQRRTRHGILHQGSVAVKSPDLTKLAGFLAQEVIDWTPEIEGRLNPRYESDAWTDRVL
ncbi:MAG: hypothetical protein P8M08_09045 [Akkermansiaceae bacterium]|nr:hypothetical protein [Akkermansiaceae bacterium]MDG2323653.1 hypothetical protein [Akkermansiaceae bacterium]